MESDKKESVIVLASGGLDSTVAIYLLKTGGFNPVPLFVDYGQVHRKEVQCLTILCEELDLEYKHIDVPGLFRYSNSGLIKGTKIESGADSVVENRNMVLLSIAVSVAASMGIKYVSYAAHKSDNLVYPDCRWEFMESFAKTARLSLDTKDFKFMMPFRDKTKANIVTLGQELGVDFSKTWSCYTAGKIHCGICPTCVERKKAFKVAGIEDPTEYEE